MQPVTSAILSLTDISLIFPEAFVSMWFFFIEIAGTAISLCGWFAMHSFRLLLAGSIMVLGFDLLMSSSGGQLKHNGLSVVFLIIGGIIGGINGYGIAETALLSFSVYSAVFVLLRLILVLLAVLDHGQES